MPGTPIRGGAKAQNSPGARGVGSTGSRIAGGLSAVVRKGDGADLWGLGMWPLERWDYASFGDGLGC